MVNSNELSVGLKNICEILNTNEIPYCLVGGLAVSMLAAPRATEDIDLMVLLNDDQKANIASLLENKFQIIQNKELFTVQQTTIWRFILKDKTINTESLLILDFILADNDIYKNSISEAIDIELNGTKIYVVTPENLISIKKLSNRGKDKLDIEALKKTLE